MAEMIQISPQVYQLSLGMVNAFLIEDKGFTLVDTGYKNSLSRIFNMLSKAGKSPHKIKQIILTHCHPDHAGSAATMQQKLNIPVYAHITETPLLEQGIAGRFQQYRTPGLVNGIIYNTFIKRSDKKNEPVRIEESLNDGDELPLVGGLEIIHTPGHSAGHIALLLKNESLLIAGDLCANIFGLQLSTVYEDLDLGIASIQKLKKYAFDKAVFGHGKALLHNASVRIQKRFADID